VPASARRAVIAARLPVHTWPERRLLITAVDVDSGERTAFDHESGVDLVDAVTASCAVPGVWPPVPIGGRRYIDGGVRSPANADLAAGAERVVILAPLVRGFGPITAVTRQAGELRRRARVALVQPDAAALRAIGRNVLDPARRAPAARAGMAQAPSAVAEIAAAWNG
jgi:NTE family protein